MRIGQTSVVVFASKVLTSVLGFATTIYFARIVGAEVVGVYGVILAVVSWLKLGGWNGVGGAMKKRISEGEEQHEYFTAGVTSILVLTALTGILLFAARRRVESYVGEAGLYTDVSVVWFVFLLLVVRLGFTTVSTTLKGQHLVHVAGVLQPLKIGLRSGAQVVLLFLGLGLVGMIAGYAVGIVLAALVGIAYLSVRPKRPSRRHFRKLFDFGKYSWFGGLKSQAFSSADILILQVFVSPALVGAYTIAWSIARFFNTFGGSVRQAVFPEISRLSAQQGTAEVRGLVEDSVTYAGLIVIPGVVGGVIIGDRILRVYGSEFVRASEVLGILLVSILCYNYMRQFVNVLNAIDRPEFAFLTNVSFVSSNVALNVLLVREVGWVGAAVASATSTGLGLVLSYLFLVRIIDFELPVAETGKQLFSALLMGGVVWVARSLVEGTNYPQHNFLIVCGLVTLGAGVYVTALLAVSSEFRSVLRRNLPVEPPYVGYE